ncbi:ABC transporter substrate-binding protein [Marivivens marinus]|uniref:ABC transporter substrate-binding protein n=1 Tax=Marivivens marinus TaxID=3110173 RepID=UPI003B84A158
MSVLRPHSKPAFAVVLAAAALTAAPLAAQDIDPPARVVSMNLCTDQLAMLLAAPGQLLSVSYVALDPLSSAMADEAQDYVINHGGAEEIYLLQPDLVLAFEWSDPIAISMLRRLGIRVEQVPNAYSLADIGPNIRLVGGLLGREAEAEAMAAAYETRLATLTTPDETGPRAAFYGANGVSSGTWSMSHQLVTAAGFHHIADELQITAAGQLPLEMLVLADPDIVFSPELYAGASQAESILDHPAYRAVAKDAGAFATSATWDCGTPLVIEALEDLHAARDRILQEEPAE